MAKFLSYVPQDIFLNDSSFIENIAYGVPLELIDFNEVVRCAKNARIHEFIISTSNGYETSVGERGIKLWWTITKNRNCQSTL